VSTHGLNTQRMSAVQKVWSSYVYTTILLQHGATAEPLHTAPRPHREMKEEKVPTRAVQTSQPSGLRRSNRSNLGQTPNRLIEDHSDHINLETGCSGRGDADAAANLANIIEANPAGQSPSLASPSGVSRDMNHAFLVAERSAGIHRHL
jgi:hypothetical protein